MQRPPSGSYEQNSIHGKFSNCSRKAEISTPKNQGKETIIFQDHKAPTMSIKTHEIRDGSIGVSRGIFANITNLKEGSIRESYDSRTESIRASIDKKNEKFIFPLSVNPINIQEIIKMEVKSQINQLKNEFTQIINDNSSQNFEKMLENDHKIQGNFNKHHEFCKEISLKVYECHDDLAKLNDFFLSEIETVKTELKNDIKSATESIAIQNYNDSKVIGLNMQGNDNGINSIQFKLKLFEDQQQEIWVHLNKIIQSMDKNVNIIFNDIAQKIYDENEQNITEKINTIKLTWDENLNNTTEQINRRINCIEAQYRNEFSENIKDRTETLKLSMEEKIHEIMIKTEKIENKVTDLYSEFEKIKIIKNDVELWNNNFEEKIKNLQLIIFNEIGKIKLTILPENSLAEDNQSSKKIQPLTKEVKDMIESWYNFQYEIPNLRQDAELLKLIDIPQFTSTLFSDETPGSISRKIKIINDKEKINKDNELSGQIPLKLNDNTIKQLDINHSKYFSGEIDKEYSNKNLSFEDMVGEGYQIFSKNQKKDCGGIAVLPAVENLSLAKNDELKSNICSRAYNLTNDANTSNIDFNFFQRNISSPQNSKKIDKAKKLKDDFKTEDVEKEEVIDNLIMRQHETQSLDKVNFETFRVKSAKKDLQNHYFDSKQQSIYFNISKSLNNDDDQGEGDDICASLIYQLDSNYYLIDENGDYILDEIGNKLQLNEEQIEQLRINKIIQE